MTYNCVHQRGHKIDTHKILVAGKAHEAMFWPTPGSKGGTSDSIGLSAEGTSLLHPPCPAAKPDQAYPSLYTTCWAGFCWIPYRFWDKVIHSCLMTESGTLSRNVHQWDVSLITFINKTSIYSPQTRQSSSVRCQSNNIHQQDVNLLTADMTKFISEMSVW